MRILIAEDDEALAKFVSQGLTAERYWVDVCSDGEQARTAANEVDYDLIVLDLNLPKLDGVSILRQLRRQKPTLPVLILTQRTKVEDRVQCLDTGADDYLPKPFSFSELSARIRALLRRSHLPSESVLSVEDLKLDRVERRVERAGRRVELTTKEFALLEYLMRNAGRSVTRAMIIEHVWNLTFDTTTNVVDVYINYLRRKVDDGHPLKLIRTVRGVGYELNGAGEQGMSASGLVAKPSQEQENDGRCQKFNPLSHLLHELNQPLTGLQCSLELAAVGQRSAEQYLRAIHEGLDLVARMRALVEALREVAEMAQDRPAVAEEIRLDALVRGMAEDLRPVAESRQVEMRIGGAPFSRSCSAQAHVTRAIFRLLDSGLSLALPESVFGVALDAQQVERATICVTWRQKGPGDLPSFCPAQLALLLARAEWQQAGGDWGSEVLEDNRTVTLRLPWSAPQTFSSLAAALSTKTLGECL